MSLLFVEDRGRGARRREQKRLAWFLTLLRRRFLLLIAFMMTVMGDPVSSVAYAIQAALGAARERETRAIGLGEYPNRGLNG